MSRATSSFLVDKEFTALASKNLIKKHSVSTVADSADDFTSAQYLSGYINCTGGGADTVTLPTGALLTDAMQNPAAGQAFSCYVINGSGGTLTFAAGASGSTLVPIPLAALTLADAAKCKMDFVLTSATAYTCFLFTPTVAT